MRLRKLFDVELPAVDQLPDGAVLLYDRQRGRWVARLLDIGGALPEHTHPPSDITPQGEGSGLDADMVDGRHAAAFALASHIHPDATSMVSGFMSASDKAKLDSIEEGAEVNQNAFSNVVVGTTTIAADNKTDTLELAAGANISLTPNAVSDRVTIAVAPQGSGSGLDADMVDGQHASAFAPASHEHTLTVLHASNTASVTINQGTSAPVTITGVSLSSGSWIIIGVVQAIANSTTSATLHSYLRSETTNLRSFSVSANSNHGLLTPVLVLLRNVSSSETITLAGATSNTSITFTVPINGGNLLAIRYGP